MMRRLFVCNTYYQLIMASHLVLTIFSDNKCDIVITDQSSSNSKNIYEKLNNYRETPFNNHFYVETKQYCSKKSVKGFANDIYNSLTNCCLFDALGQNVYDEILAFNYDLAIFSLYNRISKRNKAVVLSKYEEGILGYNHIFEYPRLKLIKLARRLTLKKNPEFERFYCFFPEQYRGEIPTIEIPSVQNNYEMLSRLLKECFSLQRSGNGYNQRYIFFTSVYDFEGGKSIGEFDAVNIIANKVGRKNILIKKHPRDTHSLYKDNGFIVDRNSSIPWEALQFNINLSGKTLLTVNSGAVLSTGLLFGNHVRAFYVYSLCDVKGNDLAQESIHEIDGLINSDFIIKKAPNIRILKDIEEL